MQTPTLRWGSQGAKVMLLQTKLADMGYNPGIVDGIFGAKTKQAVIQFQMNHKLKPNGLVGPPTWNILSPYVRGYEQYTVCNGDSLERIAQSHYTTVSQIITANPGINSRSLQSTKVIIAPYGTELIPTSIEYPPDMLEDHINSLKTLYPFIETGIIGNSVLGNPIYYIRIGTGEKKVMYNGAHHALEWITAPLLLKFAENFCFAFSRGDLIRGYDLQEIYQNSSLYIIPMVNPDGVDLVINGLSPDNPFFYDLQLWNNTGLPFSESWKANIRGVDLNLNYPANWQMAKDLEKRFRAEGPAACRHAGPAPFSEPETRALADFTKKIQPHLVIAYHTQGQVIYWNYGDNNPPRSKEIADIFSKVTGYWLEETAPEDSYAGYKDWFIQDFKRPGYTFETGYGTNPLPVSQFNRIYNCNEEAMLIAPLLVSL